MPRTLGGAAARFHRQLVVGPGDDVDVERALRKPNKIMRRVYRNGRRAVRHFRAVGLTNPVGAVSAK